MLPSPSSRWFTIANSIKQPVASEFSTELEEHDTCFPLVLLSHHGLSPFFLLPTPMAVSSFPNVALSSVYLSPTSPFHLAINIDIIVILLLFGVFPSGLNSTPKEFVHTVSLSWTSRGQWTNGKLRRSSSDQKGVTGIVMAPRDHLAARHLLRHYRIYLLQQHQQWTGNGRGDLTKGGVGPTL